MNPGFAIVASALDSKTWEGKSMAPYPQFSMRSELKLVGRFYPIIQDPQSRYSLCTGALNVCLARQLERSISRGHLAQHQLRPNPRMKLLEGGLYSSLPGAPGL